MNKWKGKLLPSRAVTSMQGNGLNLQGWHEQGLLWRLKETCSDTL